MSHGAEHGTPDPDDQAPSPTSRVPALERYAQTPLVTRHGAFDALVFRFPDGTEEVALTKGDVRGEGVLARVHSECLTGEVLGSLQCDCGPQLALAMDKVEALGRGVIVYLRQEGRGIGLGNKIRAYALQAAGQDTVEANRSLGFADDLRRYDRAALILQALGVQAVRLMTNNPDKVTALEAHGVHVLERVPHQAGASPHNRAYLTTKAERMGHLMDPFSLEDADEGR
jgi:GTP cyclohydrolase II